MERVAAGAHLPTPWLFEPAKCRDDRADYCLDCSFLLFLLLLVRSASTRYAFLQLNGVERALWANGGEGLGK